MIPTKKLVNSVETCVDESIEGFVALHPGVRQLAGQPRVIVRSDIDDFKRLGKVLTVTGGGSGHEPCFLGAKFAVIYDSFADSLYLALFCFIDLMMMMMMNECTLTWHKSYVRNQQRWRCFWRITVSRFR